MEKAQAKLVDTIGRYNLSVNNINKFQFNAREEQLFCVMMQEFAEEYHKEQSKLFGVGKSFKEKIEEKIEELHTEHGELVEDELALMKDAQAWDSELVSIEGKIQGLRLALMFA